MKIIIDTTRPIIFSFLFLGLVSVVLNACQLPNHYLIYPKVQPTNIRYWEEDIETGLLKVHLAWAAPEGSGPFPTVLIHPHGGKTTEDLKGVVWDLASRGYLAVASDYMRLLDGEFKRNAFIWRDNQDVFVALHHVRENPLVDRQRIALMGFSQGGRMSLLLAAHAGHAVKAVIAFYPIADYASWFEDEEYSFLQRWTYKIFRGHFYRESGAQSEAEFQKILQQASPLNYADRIEAPVLLVHGDADTSVSIGQSLRFKQRLQQLGKPVELLVVPQGVHIFNFRQQSQAEFAWENTLRWLESVLK